MIAKRLFSLIIIIILGLLLAFIVYCDNGPGVSVIPTPTPSKSSDETAPTVSYTPSAAQTISDDDQYIILYFSETMDTSTLTLGGGLGSSIGTPQWTSQTYDNDTVYLSPSNIWTDGSDQTLSVDAKDTAGNALETLSLTYNISITPTATLFPTGGDQVQPEQLYKDASIIITFNKSMNIETLFASGEILDGINYEIEWSQTNLTNDTATLTPATGEQWNPTTSGDFILSCEDTSGNSIEEIEVYYATSSYPPQVGEILPLSNDIIDDQRSISIQFMYSSMDPSKLQISGTMGSDDYEVEWISLNYDNDTLLISPSSEGWTAGSNRTLIINCKDIFGNDLDMDDSTPETIEPLELAYHIHDGKLYVNYQTGLNRNPGTHDLPFKSIENALELANLLPSQPDIIVAEGTYYCSLIITQPIKIYGGYSSTDWNDYDPQTYTTNLYSTALENTAIKIEINDPAIEGEVTIQGFNIYSHEDDWYIIEADAENVFIGIYDNYLECTSGSDKCDGIELNAPGKITGNHIQLLGDPFSVFGIMADQQAENAMIANNLITGGSLSNSTFGIITFGLRTQIINNTLSLGATNKAIGIYTYFFLTYIDNNIIEITAGTDKVGVQTEDEEGIPESLSNNNFYNCTTGLYAKWVGDGNGDCLSSNDYECYTTICSGNVGNGDCSITLSDPVGANNIAVDPTFTTPGSDYHLSSSSPTSVTQGGKTADVSDWDDFPQDTSGNYIDLDAETRTGSSGTGWSIGAYEYDG